MRGRKVVWAALAASACAAAAACGSLDPGSRREAGENGIYVTDKLEVRSAMVYTAAAPNEKYDSEELAAFAGEWVSAYNEAHGARAAAVNERGQERLPVAIRSCTLEGETGTLVLEYGSPEHFAGFAAACGDDTHTVTALSVGRVRDLGEDEAFMAASLVKADGSGTEDSEVAKKAGYRVLAIEGAGVVRTQGRVEYMSSEGVSLRDTHTAETGEGLHYIVFR